MFCLFNESNICFSQKTPEFNEHAEDFALIHYNIDTIVVDSVKVEKIEHELDSVQHKMDEIKNENNEMKSENEIRSIEKQIISTIIALFILISIWNRKRKNKNHG